MADLTVRDPWNEMRSLMRRAFDEPFPRRFWDDVPGFVNGDADAARGTLALDVYETEDGLTVEAAVPGFKKDEIDVTLERGKLTIRAEHGEDQRTEGRNYFVRERRYGAVSRSVLIGDSWDPESISGNLHDGVLTLTVRKAKEAQPRRVQIA